MVKAVEIVCMVFRDSPMSSSSDQGSRYCCLVFYLYCIQIAIATKINAFILDYTYLLQQTGQSHLYYLTGPSSLLYLFLFTH